MSLLETALTRAAAVAAARPEVPLAPAAALEVADAIAEVLPPPRALEPLWPQLARYAVSIAGSILVGRGLVAESDWPVIAGAILALGPPVYRTVSTWLARRGA